MWVGDWLRGACSVLRASVCAGDFGVTFLRPVVEEVEQRLNVGKMCVGGYGLLDSLFVLIVDRDVAHEVKTG